MNSSPPRCCTTWATCCPSRPAAPRRRHAHAARRGRPAPVHRHPLPARALLRAGAGRGAGPCGRQALAVRHPARLPGGAVGRLAAQLVLQGGVFSPDEAAAFIARPGAQEAVRLRLWDDLAKAPSAPRRRWRTTLNAPALRPVLSAAPAGLAWPVVAAVLLGALLHAGWNALVKSSGDKPLDTALVHLLGAVVALRCCWPWACPGRLGCPTSAPRCWCTSATTSPWPAPTSMATWA